MPVSINQSIDQSLFNELIRVTLYTVLKKKKKLMNCIKYGAECK